MNRCPELAFKPQGTTTHSVPPAPNSPHLNPNTFPTASNPHRLSSPLTSSSSSSSTSSTSSAAPHHHHSTAAIMHSKANGGGGEHVGFETFFVSCDQVMVSPCKTDFRETNAVDTLKAPLAGGCYTKKGNEVNFSHTHGKKLCLRAQAQAPGGAVRLSTEAIAPMRRGVRRGCYKAACFSK